MNRLTLFMLAGAVAVPSQGKAQAPIVEKAHRYMGWKDKLLERAQEEGYLRAVGELNKYGAILYFRWVDRHSKEISRGTWVCSDELIDILTLAGVLTPSSDTSRVGYTSAFLSFVGRGIASRLPTDPRQWEWEHLKLFYDYLISYFPGPERKPEGLYRPYAEMYAHYVERTYNCRGLGCLTIYKRLLSTSPYAFSVRDTVAPSPAPEQRGTTPPVPPSREETPPAPPSPVEVERAKWEKGQQGPSEEEEETPPSPEELPQLPSQQEEGGASLIPSYSFPQKGGEGEKGGAQISSSTTPGPERQEEGVREEGGGEEENEVEELIQEPDTASAEPLEDQEGGNAEVPPLSPPQEERGASIGASQPAQPQQEALPKQEERDSGAEGGKAEEASGEGAGEGQQENSGQESGGESQEEVPSL